VDTQTDPDAAARAHVVRTFMPDGVLLKMPAKQGKRRLLLDEVAGRFEPGVRYPEAEVDEILQSVTDGGESDHVTLRRYLVDACLLSREAGEYWRSGGWVAGT
jgi:hypothetical protein